MTKTIFELHIERWKNGCGSHLCSRARKIVLCRGEVPADIFFLGEAPGKSENVIGQPFVGPAGALLQDVIDEVMPEELTYCLSNLVGCLPMPDDKGRIGDPDDMSVECCRPRLEELMEIVNPRMVVAVGKVPLGWLERGYKWSIRLPSSKPVVIGVIHPSAVLQANIAQRGLLRQRLKVTLSNAIEEMLEGPQ